MKRSTGFWALFVAASLAVAPVQAAVQAEPRAVGESLR